MKLLSSITFALVLSFNVSANKTENSETSGTANKADACSSCHNAMVSLQGRGVEVIIKQTNAIKSGEKSHLPAGINELSDKDIAEIAAYLDKA
jgi:cytochrome c553